MLHRLLAPALVAMLVGVSGPSAGEKDKKKGDNPFRTAKVGDFAIYKTASAFGEKTTKKTVIAKDEKSIKLKIKVALGEAEKTIDLTKPFRLTDDISKGDKFEKSGAGKEKIKVAGKEYDANWITGKISGKIFTSEIKVWFSKDAPLDGLLRMKFGSNLTELIESGSAK